MTIPTAVRGLSHRRPSAGSTRRALWSGGVATAVVAGLIALVGILVCRWLFKIPILSPRQDGAWGDASTAGYVFASAAIALAATGLMHLLLLATPQPRMFFGFIMALATLVAVVFPFSTTAPFSQKLATGRGQPGARRRHLVAGLRGLPARHAAPGGAPRLRPAHLPALAHPRRRLPLTAARSLATRSLEAPARQMVS